MTSTKSTLLPYDGWTYKRAWSFWKAKRAAQRAAEQRQEEEARVRREATERLFIEKEAEKRRQYEERGAEQKRQWEADRRRKQQLEADREARRLIRGTTRQSTVKRSTIYRPTEHTVVYFAENGADEVIYIGISNNTMRRWREHLAKKPWADEVEAMYVHEKHPTKWDAMAREEALIKQYRPRYNVVHNCGR